MANFYSVEFKMAVVRRIETTGVPIAEIAAELGVNGKTLHAWLNSNSSRNLSVHNNMHCD